MPNPVVTAPTNQTATARPVILTALPINLGSFTDSHVGPWNVVVSWGDGLPNTTFTQTTTGVISSAKRTIPSLTRGRIR